MGKRVKYHKKSHNCLSAVSSMSIYLKDIDKIPLLSRTEEEEITNSFRNCCQHKLIDNKEYNVCSSCNALKEKLIVSNLRFVVSVAKKYQGNNLSFSDLINEGNLGLLTAVDKFDPSLGYHFISYAVWWIKQSIMKAISEKSRMIRLPMNKTNELFKIAKFIEQYTREFGVKPSDSIMECHLGIERFEIKRILDLASGHSSLEELSDSDFFEPSSQDIVSCDTTPEKYIISKSLFHNIDELLKELPEREQFILVHRFGLKGNENLSLSTIGTMLELTKERIRQLEKQALENLKIIAKEKQMMLYCS